MVETLDDVDIDDDDDTELKGMKSNYLCNDSKEDTLLMAVILSSLRDGGKLSLMNENNDTGGINWPRLWLLFFRNVNTFYGSIVFTTSSVKFINGLNSILGIFITCK